MTPHLHWLDKEIERIIPSLRDHIDHDPSLREPPRWLDSVPDLGERTLAVRLAFSATPGRFGNVRQALALARLDPRPQASGTSLKGHLGCPKSLTPSCEKRAIGRPG